jgi:vacuolar-type H+-ATPase subunit E/Vma4
VNLESLRTAFLEQAEAEAARRRAEVEAERERRLAGAQAEASSLVEQGKLDGRLAARQESARRRGAARRRAREALLGVCGAMYGELRSRARTEALELRSDPGYRALLDRLVEAARAQLGPEAEIETDLPYVGGVLGRAGSRSVDYTLPALADRALEELDGEVEMLWQ